MDMTDARILIVDDEAIHRRFARIVLEAADWQVDEADGGQSALARLDSGGYALVLLDLQMPAPDGFAVARAVRANDLPGDGADPVVPILAFTAMRGPDVVAMITAAGMDGHLPKPTTPEALLAAVGRWHPGRQDPTRVRLAEMFGAEEFGALLFAFETQLQEALDGLDRDGEEGGVAHRIAGIAGTLGFPDVSAAWLALSEGDGTAVTAARLTSRRAIAAIRRDRDAGR